jgi:hypothetical protein
VWSDGANKDGSTRHLFWGERQCGVWFGGGAEPVWGSAADIEALLSASAPSGRKWLRPVKLKIWLSGLLAKPFLFGPIEGLREDSEAFKIAQAKAHEATGLAGPCDVRIEGVPGREAAIATVASGAVLKRLQGLSGGAGLSTVSIRPWWAAATVLPLGESDTTLLAVHDGESLTLLAERGRQWIAADNYPATDRVDEPQRALIRRRAMGLRIATTRLVLLSRDGTGGQGGGLPCWPMPTLVEVG